MGRSWTTIGDLSSEQVFDSRDVEKWIDELESNDERTEEETETLEELQALRDECGSEWVHGIGFYRDDYFEDHARELAEDCGYVKDIDKSPLAECIDWERWAELVKQDYSSTEINGETFWFRE